MKQWYTTEFKGNVIISYEDPDLARRDSFNCTYQEAWGLLHSLERLRDNPSFAEREPRPTHSNGQDKNPGNGRAVTRTESE